MKQSVVIIGGGLGGLFTGAILAKEGLHVTVLEKNATIGGGLQTFRRFGEVFDTGMHVIGGLQPGGNIWSICRYLGILDQISIRDVDAEGMDHLYFSEDQRHYVIPKGKEAFVSSLATQFPEEADGLQRYVDAIFALSEEVDLFYLRPARTDMVSHSEAFLMAADDLIARYIRDERLRSILAYMNPLYGGRGQQTPAYVHAIISVLYISGTSRFVGGSSHFADLLAEVITKQGGEVVTGDGVEWIEVQERQVQYVKTRKGRTYQADWYISDVHPCTLIRLMDQKALPKSYRERLDSIPNAYSAFSLYVKMKPDTFPYMNYSEYYMTRYADVWQFGDSEKPWPLGFMLMTPPEPEQGPYSRKVLVTAPMTFDHVRRWEDSTTGHRGADYEAWKQEMADRLLTQVEELHPGFREQMMAVNTSSPLTIRDYYGVKEGAISGFSKDCRNITLSMVPVVTKVRNLLLTGQNNNLHGFCGVPLTAILTCEAILGQNYVLEKIHSCKDC